MKLRAYILMTLVVAVWGSTFVVVKGALSDATPVAFNLLRMTLAFVLLASALKLLGVPSLATGVTLATMLAVAPVVWMALRRRHGFSALPTREMVQSG